MDWNSDGKIDLLVGERNGYIRIYLNVGTSANPVFTGYTNLSVGGATFNCGATAKPDVVDWNNDGKKDLIVGDDNGNVSLLLNTGSNAAPAFAARTYVKSGGSDLSVGAYGRASPVAVDWDRDGKKDLIVGETYGSMYYFRNIGTDANPAFAGSEALRDAAGAAISLVYYARPEVADWNNDGLMDIIAGGYYGAVYCFRGIMGGDATGDNRVNVDDLGALASNYGLAGRCWSQSDFTGDGLVNVDDLGIMATKYDWVAPGGSSTVPAPVPLGLLLPMLLPMLLARRRAVSLVVCRTGRP